ncbi:DsbA family protein [Citreimonas sp.]|uniref:DsbA family protein n=1 Tax=Citreimonas sp. TaxID=3036715 RepID=UPI0035C85C30
MNTKISAVALAAAIVGGGWWVAGQGTAPDATIALPGAASAQEATDTETASETAEITEMTLGAEDAPVEVIEYASYTCPHCAAFHEDVFPQMKEDYIDTGKVRFTYREVYFDKYGMWASLVARCGGEERFFGITDMIYDTQGSWSRAGSDAAIADELRKIGRMAGLDNEQLESCLTDAGQLRGLVEWYQANAEEHNVRATPTFVIDGETYSNMSYAEFSDILDERLGE